MLKKQNGDRSGTCINNDTLCQMTHTRKVTQTHKSKEGSLIPWFMISSSFFLCIFIHYTNKQTHLPPGHIPKTILLALIYGSCFQSGKTRFLCYNNNNQRKHDCYCYIYISLKSIQNSFLANILLCVWHCKTFIEQ